MNFDTDYEYKIVLNAGFLTPCGNYHDHDDEYIISITSLDKDIEKSNISKTFKKKIIDELKWFFPLKLNNDFTINSNGHKMFSLDVKEYLYSAGTYNGKCWIVGEHSFTLEAISKHRKHFFII